MTSGLADPMATCRRILEATLTRGGGADPTAVAELGTLPAAAVDEAMRGFAEAHGAAALEVLTALGSEPAARPVRRAAKRALYHLAQRGVVAPRSAPRPVVERRQPQATRAWVSGIDGSGSRGLWILFDDGWGGLAVCSMIVNDTAGIVDVGGGPISRKRLERELERFRTTAALSWVETEPAHAAAVVGEALEVQGKRSAPPPEAFAAWRRFFEPAPPPPPLPAPGEADPALVDRSAELLELPELGGWYLDPQRLQSDGVELLEARESRLVLSDQLKAEREEAIVTRVVEREFGPEARRRWARRLAEMAAIFAATERPDPAKMARAAAAALADPERQVARQPIPGLLARRGLEIAGEVVLGRVKPEEAALTPGATPAPGPRIVRP